MRRLDHVIRLTIVGGRILEREQHGAFAYFRVPPGAPQHLRDLLALPAA